jgi:thioredoxin 1
MTNNEAFSVASRDEFDRRVLRADTPVLVDFSAEWCGPCRAIEPTIERLAAEYGERLAVAKVDIDEQAALAAEYHVRSVPTVMLIAGGTVQQVLVGSRSPQDYRAAIDAVLQ